MGKEYLLLYGQLSDVTKLYGNVISIRISIRTGTYLYTVGVSSAFDWSVRNPPRILRSHPQETRWATADL